MNRREMLATTGAAIATASLGGCVSQYTDNPGADGGDETTESKPTLGEQSLKVTKAGCGTQKNEATVELADSKVTVTGTIPGSDSCQTATLGDVSYSPDDGTLDVTVTTKKKEGTGVCSQCITEIDYEATFQFEGGLPSNVTVTHESMGNSETVAEKGQ
ncbi:hypothetical protein [Halorussus halophilus]|uniref:hypothetical protein n=1 Tax=Halorussus halophilus TaxID=2650975 RepID=UPI001301681C|nr:hypothetical protein [Halorussus halophilus]